MENFITNLMNPSKSNNQDFVGPIQESLIQKRISSLKTFGVATPNKFIARIFPPSNKYFSKDSAEYVSLSCLTASLPGKSFNTLDRMERGHTRKIPYSKMFPENSISLSFAVSNNMLEKIFFDAWQDLIIDNKNHDVNFYNNIISKIEIYQLDRTLNKIYGIEIREAYPISITSLPLDVASNDSHHKLDVTFSYYEWKEILTSMSAPLPEFSIDGAEKMILDSNVVEKNEINTSKFEDAINKLKSMKETYNDYKNQYDTINNAAYNYVGTYTSVKNRIASGGLDAFGAADMIENNI